MSEQRYDFPFNITDVADMLNIRIRRRGGKSIYADCPFCDDTRGKLNLNLEKNCFRCNYCGKSGGMVVLYAEVHNISNTEAYREICEILHGQEYKVSCACKEKTKLPESSTHASLYNCNQTYEMLLSLLNLTDNHIKKLKERGLSDEDIQKNGYKSTPTFGFDRLTDMLIKKGCVVEGVPGFYKKGNGEWTMNFKSSCFGILIPVRSVSGLILGFQIRLDKPFEYKNGRKTKYIWFSSSEEDKGVSSGGPVHFVGNPCDETVFITEGPLKADVAHALSGRTFLAVAGVGNLKGLSEPLEILKRNGTRTIYDAYDMDKHENVHVKQAEIKLISLIKSHGFNAKILNWDTKFKGIDDYLLSLKQ